MEIHQSLVGRCLLSYMLLILQGCIQVYKRKKLWSIHVHCRTRPGCTYIYVHVPPMNLQANLSHQGKMKLVRISKRIKKTQKLTIFGSAKGDIFKIIRLSNSRKWGLRFNCTENKERWRVLILFQYIVHDTKKTLAD